jgi:hypothetical protein
MGKDKAMMAVVAKMKKDDKAKYDAMMKDAQGMMKDAEGMMATDPMGAMDKMNAAKGKMDDMSKMMPAKKDVVKK